MSKEFVHKRIVISGGGTGGHLYPGLAVADLLRREESEILYLGSGRGLEAEVVPKEGYDFLAVPSKGIAGTPAKKLMALLTLGVGTVKALIKMFAYKPHLVIGTGGFVCVPAVVSAAILGVPVVLLEQNAVPGKATKLLSKMARAVCLSFEDTKKYFPGCRTEWTGNPLRSQIQKKTRVEACKALDLDPGRPTLLVAGASQGATSINRALVDALADWQDKEWNIIHLTGRNHLARVQARVETILPRGSKLCYRSFGFRKDMENLYSASDLVVSRAGATTIAELTCLGLPTIFVPYPYAGGHQKENARVVVDSGGAKHIPDESVGEELRGVVEDLLSNPTCLQDMSVKSQQTARPDAALDVVNVCREVMK